MFVMLMKESHVFLKLDVDESNPASALLAPPSSLYLGNLIHLSPPYWKIDHQQPSRHRDIRKALQLFLFCNHFLHFDLSGLF
jgi:hypothetical protein